MEHIKIFKWYENKEIFRRYSIDSVFCNSDWFSFTFYNLKIWVKMKLRGGLIDGRDYNLPIEEIWWLRFGLDFYNRLKKKIKMKKLLLVFNHEVWKFCCGKWFDRRNEDHCPSCGKK